MLKAYKSLNKMRTEAANNKNNNVICSKHHSHPPPVPNHRTHQCTPDNRKQTPQRCNSVCSSSGSTSSSSGPGRLRRLLSLGSPRTRLETAFVPSSSSTPPPTSSSSGGSPAASLGRPPSAPPSFTSRSSPAGPQQSPGRRTTSRTSSPIYCRTDSPIYGRTGSPLLHNSNTIFEEEWSGGDSGGSKGGRTSSSTPDQAGRLDEDGGGGGGTGGSGGGGGSSRSRSSRTRDMELRRHTLSTAVDHRYTPTLRSIDLEMGTKSNRRKSPQPRGYPPPSMLLDDDPGIMSEVETSSTGFRRGNKQRSSLPVVRTPSKTLERPLGMTVVGGGRQPQAAWDRHHHAAGQAGPPQPQPVQPGQHYCGLVFLQYRSETKRALLPNEITSIDTVKALFVRSFPKQLTMEYMESPHVKIYIHDSSKDMFYELEDLRSHLRDIRDRSVLRLFESEDVVAGGLGLMGTVMGGTGGPPMGPIPTWDHDQSYFSEPEFDSDHHHQHVHKTKASKSSVGGAPYYMTHSFPPGGGSGGGTLPRGGSSGSSASLLRGYASAPKPPPSVDGYMSSPERSSVAPRGYPGPGYTIGGGYDDPYYAAYTPRTGAITPVIDEEASDTEELTTPTYKMSRPPAQVVPHAQIDQTRLRVEHMERQLASLTGLVQKALNQQSVGPGNVVTNAGGGPVITAQQQPALQPPHIYHRSASDVTDDYDKHSSSSSASLPDDTFLRTDTKPPKLGRDKSVSFEKSVSFSDEPPDMSSPKQHSPQHSDRDRHKPTPPPKPVSLSPGQYESRNVYRDLQLTAEMYNHLRGLQKKAKDLKQEVRNLRRMSQTQAHTVRESIRDVFLKIRSVLVAAGGEGLWSPGGDETRLRVNREGDLYRQQMIRLEADLTELEGTVEELRGNVINRKTRVNMSDVESMAMVLNKSSKTVAELKLRFPSLQDAIKNLIAQEMEKVVSEEKFLKEEPERLESALRRCKKLTGTLVTLKRLASVQEQRLPDSRLSPTLDETPPITPTSGKTCGDKESEQLCGEVVGPESGGASRPENPLDALLDELQSFSKPGAAPGTVTGSAGGSSLRRLHSYPSSDRPLPPAPPPRTSSKSPSESNSTESGAGTSSVATSTTNTSTAATTSTSVSRQEMLEQKHQELLRKQRALQEQYTRLQALQRSQPPPDLLQLKKTGSESNLLGKMGLTLAPTGSLSHLASAAASTSVATSTSTSSTTTTSKIYETDIL
ncbi:coiled-coil domain-containing protein AGAP005037 isoform X9 [Rhodnius prolixus]|uniref:coiled-coil domain-containing protein AGAP005037 isoform X9 n=1 Tax=Rhodnius prolixus TaxID=13249 RepID=UPI003D188926